MIAINRLVAAGLETAWSLAEESLTDCSLKTSPATTVVMATEEETITWGNETELKALIYGEKQEQEEPGNEDDRGVTSVGWTATALIRAVDLPDGVEPAHDSVLVAGAKTWHVTSVAKVPTGAIFILELNR